MCCALDDGADPVDLGLEILENTDLTTHQAAVFVVASVGNYCPEYTGTSNKPSTRGGPAAAAGPPHHHR